MCLMGGSSGNPGLVIAWTIKSRTADELAPQVSETMPQQMPGWPANQPSCRDMITSIQRFGAMESGHCPPWAGQRARRMASQGSERCPGRDMMTLGRPAGQADHGPFGDARHGP